MSSIRNEFKVGIGLAAYVIARFVQLGIDRGWQQSTYCFDRCWDLDR